jgi:hypothetical protein
MVQRKDDERGQKENEQTNRAECPEPGIAAGFGSHRRERTMALAGGWRLTGGFSFLPAMSNTTNKHIERRE